jgi:hypothetical protein
MRTTQLLLNELPYRGDLFLPEKLHAPAALAVSQSGSGAHIWIDRYRSALLFSDLPRGDSLASHNSAAAQCPVSHSLGWHDARA